jgi:hypothetical protein
VILASASVSSVLSLLIMLPRYLALLTIGITLPEGRTMSEREVGVVVGVRVVGVC